MKLLLLSSSRAGDSEYLVHAENYIKEHLGPNIKKLLFLPYAGVTISYEQYAKNVAMAFERLGYQLESIEDFSNPKIAIENANAIVVGGGNTFCLLDSLYRLDLLSTLKIKLEQETPYIGWSAGSNICGLSIRTTNDMPIVQPPSFEALGALPLQINPHYIDGNPPGHHVETREQRIAEFLIKNPDMKVLGIPEGTAITRKGKYLKYVGTAPGYLFSKSEGKVLIQPNSDLSFLV